MLNVWQVGDAKITRVVEGGDFPIDPALLFSTDRHAVRQQAWLQPHFSTPNGDLVMSIHAFVIEIGRRRILVDTCIGNDKKRHASMWNNLQGPFLSDLAAAGYPADSIDTVVCTHLHIDHVGWNTRWVDGRWLPTFPNARYLFGRIEWDHWRREAEAAIEGSGQSEAAYMMETGVVIADSIRPIMEAGLHQLVEVDHRLADDVYLEHTPGHTPGHVCVHIASRGAHAVITGDMIHHPLQCSLPELGTHIDSDAARGTDTRLDFFARHSGRPTLVLGSHFPTPTAGWIVPDGERWRFSVDPPKAPSSAVPSGPVAMSGAMPAAR
jgi:glyoxylase-like metal-dependent hydrolase (beta-lactamase superfamily II)